MGNHQGVFGCNILVTGYMFCISQIPKKKWHCSWMVHQLFIDCSKAYDSVRRAVLCNLFIESGIPMKHFSLIKMSSSDTFIAVQVGKCLSYIQGAAFNVTHFESRITHLLYTAINTT
jgi:hypothetical protein